jgi:hypothetical protein
MFVLAMGTEFPVTERVAEGVSYGEMFAELKNQPMFFLWLICMFMTASAELAPGQWVDLALSRVAVNIKDFRAMVEQVKQERVEVLA